MPRRVERLAAAAAFVLASCGGSPHGPADEAFVARMIPHHHLGMMLIDEATHYSDGVELRRMVFEMGSYHRDELAQLDDWAGRWRVAGARTFPGDLAADDVARLSTLRGPGHDTWWLHLMLAHHRGALVIARDALASALDRRVKEMAETVISVQEKQIADMEELAAGLCRNGHGLPGC